MPPDEITRAGQAVYTPLTLKLYDWYVLGLSNRLLWRCPTPRLRALYDRCVGARHLDVGVGTGYYLDKARWPVAKPAITLLDLNAHSLAAAARRIARYRPRAVAADVLKPLPADAAAPEGGYDSVGLCYLLHCLPGALPEKAAAVFDHVRPLMAADAVLFGATIVQGDAPRSRLARRLMGLYNRKGIFSNADDTEPDRRAALEARWVDVRLERHGCVVAFEARRARAGA